MSTAIVNVKLVLVRAFWAGFAAALALISFIPGQTSGVAILFLCAFLASRISISILKIQKNYLYWIATIVLSAVLLGAIGPFFLFPFPQTPSPVNFSEWLAGVQLIFMGSVLLLPYTLVSIVAFVLGDVFIMKVAQPKKG